jgi:hypothetical protein
MWYRKQVKIQEVLTWQEFKHGTPYHVTLQASRPLDCCCKTSVMPLILKAQTLFLISDSHWVFHAAGSRWFIHLLEPDHQAAAGLEKTQLYQLSTTPRFWNPQFWAICINWYEFWVEFSPKLVNFGFTTWIIGTARSSWRLARNPLAPSRKMPKAPSLWPGATHIFRFCWTKKAVLL